VLSDEGQLVLVQPTPASYQELGRVPGPRGTCWSMPAVSNGRIYARSSREGVCLDAAVKPAETK
jgi:outer membrane protein assembly factor BamB